MGAEAVLGLDETLAERPFADPARSRRDDDNGLEAQQATRELAVRL